MQTRIADGNGIAPPRNLIDLASKAQQAQQRKEAREDREFEPGEPLIGGDALKRGLSALSTERVQDTLLAEAGDYADTIALFRDGKAEHNTASLAEILGVDTGAAIDATKPLLDIGFLEQTGDSFKIPMLYRDGLKITQGKAFEATANGEDAIE